MDDIKILKNTKLELELGIPEESHTICNALRKILMEDEDVDYAVYGIDHPLIGEPQITIKVKKGKSPKKALLKASNELKSQTEEFKKLIEAI